jgi:hypothetical protein
VHDGSQFVAEIGEKSGHFAECAKKIPAVTHFAPPVSAYLWPVRSAEQHIFIQPQEKDAFFTERDAERSTLCIDFPDGMRRWLAGYKSANESDERLPAKYQ